MMKKFTALCCAASLFMTGVPHVIAAHELELPILMYHHISTLPEQWGDYVVSTETFEGDLRMLSELGYTSISLAELIAYVEGRGALPEKAVMITFDDGQRSFSEYALPLLEKYDMCALAAIVGKYADDYTANGDTNVNYAYMAWPELARLAQNPHVELLAHSYDMHSLQLRRGCAIMAGESAGDYEKSFSADINLLNSRCAEHIGEIPLGFAYPFGIRSKVAAELLINAGYRALFTCDEKINYITREPDCLYELGRFNRPNGVDRQQLFSQMGIK